MRWEKGAASPLFVFLHLLSHGQPSQYPIRPGTTPRTLLRGAGELALLRGMRLIRARGLPCPAPSLQLVLVVNPATQGASAVMCAQGLWTCSSTLRRSCSARRVRRRKGGSPNSRGQLHGVQTSLPCGASPMACVPPISVPSRRLFPGQSAGSNLPDSFDRNVNAEGVRWAALFRCSARRATQPRHGVVHSRQAADCWRDCVL